MHPQYAILLLGTCSALVITGCKTPANYREQADRSAYAIVNNARKGVTKEETAFTIDPPSVTLRRKLITLQDLPAYSAATLGTRELTPPPLWPSDALPPLQTTTNAVALHQSDDGTVELSLLDAIQIAARNSYPKFL